MAPGLQSGTTNADLDRRLKALEKAISVGVDGSITIETNTSLNIKAGAMVTIKTNGMFTIDGPSMITLKAGLIKLNNGGKPVFRTGDFVINGMASIGSPTVLA